MLTLSTESVGMDDQQFSALKLKRWLSYLLIMSVMLLVYMDLQHRIYHAGIAVPDHAFHVFDSIIHSFIVPMIMMASGVFFNVLCERYRRSQILFKLIDYVVYPYLIWSLIQGFAEVKLNIFSDGKKTFLHVINAIPAHPSDHFQYLYAIFLSYCLGLIFCYRASKPVVWLGFLLAAVVYLFSQLFSRYELLSLLASHWVMFMSGLVMAGYLNTLFARRMLLAAISLPFFVAVQWLFHGYFGFESYVNNLPTLLLQLVSVFALAMVFLGICQRPAGVVMFLAQAVIPVFLLHMLVGSATRLALSNVFHVDSFYWHLSIDIGVAVMAGIVLFWLAERIGMTWWWYLKSPYDSASWSERFAGLRSRFILMRYVSNMIIAGLVVLPLSVYGGSEWVLRQRVKAPAAASNIQLSSSAEVLQQGKRLAQIYGCYLGCHGKNLQGGLVLDKPFVATYIAPDLTVAFARYSLNELETVVRYGIRPDGSRIVGPMPTAGFQFISHDDLTAIFSFLQTLPAVEPVNAQTHLGWISRFHLLKGDFQFPYNDVVKFGKQFSPSSNGERLVRSACSECHGVDLNGSAIAPPLLVAKAYSFDDFYRLQRTGIALGGREVGLMSQMARHRFSNFTDDELHEIYDFLSSR